MEHRAEPRRNPTSKRDGAPEDATSAIVRALSLRSGRRSEELGSQEIFVRLAAPDDRHLRTVHEDLGGPWLRVVLAREDD